MNQPRLRFEQDAPEQIPLVDSGYTGQATKDYDSAMAQNPSDVKRRVERSILNGDGMANRKSVWVVSTAQFPGEHFATFPEDLIKPCILAGSKAGYTILDPFAGSGTTGEVALKLGRSFPSHSRVVSGRIPSSRATVFAFAPLPTVIGTAPCR